MDDSWEQFLWDDELWNPPPFQCMDLVYKEQEQHNLEQNLIQEVQECHVPSISDHASLLAVPSQGSSNMHFRKQLKREEDERAPVPVVEIRTRSETTQLDDGFRWHKYGRKILRNNKNPRHYYKCAEADCAVKRTVEKDPNNESLVITIYRGTHNHFSPYEASSITELLDPTYHRHRQRWYPPVMPVCNACFFY